ncbi:hypothetical protein [Roseofilum casamattae]|uniref:Uncharacterized protein n=1 Tax=Roseofilum casamattae BLCC-M143 TaxID=3022442 RepID=A0ABT7BYP4_9CYAN|nr:hypothetical protein [Roseofilum casamattae]MDJ1184323.1 hypothetical protein [Roseofilum casamattae BLCC-M143]
MEQAENTQETEQSKSKNTLSRRFLENILIDKYDITIDFIGKSLWPTLALVISILFYSDISYLVSQLSRSLSRTSKITVAEVEFEIYAESLLGSDLEVHDLISEISHQDLSLILDLGSKKLQIEIEKYTPEYRERFKSLIDRRLVSIDPNAVSVVNSDPVVQIELTDTGKRVHRELQNIIINFVKGLPIKPN